MHIAALSDQNAPAALAYLRSSPYRNALLLSNLSQLRNRCDMLIAERNEQIVGIASTYFDLPVANLIFAAERDDTVQALLSELAIRNPHLQHNEIMALLPAPRFQQLARIFPTATAEVEYQMAVEPEALRDPGGPSARRLGTVDLPAMAQLAEAAGLSVWHESALDLGPAFGCFEDGQLVAMAATHFATPEVIEIGHIATLPAFRRRGYALACTAAVTRAAFTLAPRVFLMVLEHNTAARATYRRLGFYPVEAFHLATFRMAA